MNVVLDDPSSVPYFSDMKSTLAAAGIKPAQFDWYLSDLETNLSVAKLPVREGWLSGEELAAVLETPDLQFIWAVFSAFPKGVRVEVAEEPCADGNPSYWNDPNLSPQLGQAEFELVAWDSSATILVGVPERAGLAFMRSFPSAKLHGVAVGVGDG